MRFPIEQLREIVGFGNELTLKFIFGENEGKTVKVLVQPSVKVSDSGNSEAAKPLDAVLSCPLHVEGTEAEIAEALLDALQGYRTTRESLAGLRTNLRELEEAEKTARVALATAKKSKSAKGVSAPISTPVAPACGSEEGDDEEPEEGDEKEPSTTAAPEAPPTPEPARPATNPLSLF